MKFFYPLRFFLGSAFGLFGWATLLAIASLSTVSLAEFFRVFDSETKIVEEAIVQSIHDGDTIRVTCTREYPIRLINCWAPEITGKEKEQGLKSKAGLESLLKIGDKVTVEIPTEKNQPKSTLGRTLAFVYKDLDGDGIDDNISKEMVKRGFAKEKK